MTDIRKGDLVMVVRWPHPESHFIRTRLGEVFEVTTIGPARCYVCGYDFPQCAYIGTEGIFHIGIPLPWLKRIPPLSDLEGVNEREPVTVER